MPTQDHCHIGLALGGAPENAPSTTYRVQEYRPFFTADIDIVRGATGLLFFGTYVDDSGDPIVFRDVDLTLFVTQSEFETLQGMVHQPVYYVPNIHPNTGSDHTNYVRQMIMGGLKYVRRFDPMLDQHTVAVSLVDNDTVTS